MIHGKGLSVMCFVPLPPEIQVYARLSALHYKEEAVIHNCNMIHGKSFSDPTVHLSSKSKVDESV